MERRNIYKADDVLIIGSFFMLIPAVYLSWPWLSGIAGVRDWGAYLSSAPLVLGSRIVLILAYLAGAVTAQAIGRVIRHKEKQTLDILDTVMYMGKATVSQVAGNLSLSEARVRKLTGKLTRLRGLNIRMEGDVITREILVEPAPENRENPELRKTEAFSTPLTNLSPELQEYLKNDKSDIFGKMDKLRRIAEAGGDITVEDLSKPTPEKEAEKKKMRGKIVLLFILFMTPLWPVAIIVIIYNVIKQYKKLKDKGLINQNAGHSGRTGE